MMMMMMMMIKFLFSTPIECIIRCVPKKHVTTFSTMIN